MDYYKDMKLNTKKKINEKGSKKLVYLVSGSM